MSERRRAGIALALILPAASIGALMAIAIAPGPVGSTVYFLCKLHLLLLPVLWWRFVEKQPWSGSPLVRGGLGMGVGSGLVIFSVIIATFALLGELVVDAEKLRAVAEKNQLAQRGVYIALAIYWSFVNSLLEEYVWRWFVFTRCRVLMGPVSSAFVVALGFTVHHTLALQAQFDVVTTILGSVGVFVGSLWWSWCYDRYRSIWPGYVCHVFADLAVFGVGWVLLFES